jgi:hypothetical protein
LASAAVNWWSLLARAALTRACARPRRRRGLVRFADPFWVRDRARCRCLRWVRASRGAREASRVATGFPPAVATTAAVLTPTSTPTAAPDGLLNPCGAAVAVRSKHTDAYQQPPASLLTVTFSIRAAHQQPPELGLRPARRGEGDPPVLGDPQATRLKAQTVGGREPGPVPVAGLEPGKPGLALQETGVCHVCGADAVPERPDRLLDMPRHGRVLDRVPASNQVEVRERPGPVHPGDVVGGLPGPLVLVRLDLGQVPVECEPARARCPNKHGGLSVGRIEAQPHTSRAGSRRWAAHRRHSASRRRQGTHTHLTHIARGGGSQRHVRDRCVQRAATGGAPRRNRIWLRRGPP